MKQKIILILLIISPVFFCFSKDLKFDDINPVLGTFFDYHIETKELNEEIIKRSLKVYIDQYDPGHIFLLESEANKYLNIKTKELTQIKNRMLAKDYSDYLALNEMIQKSIIRSRKLRADIEKELIINDIDQIEDAKFTTYAKNEKELAERQKTSIGQFYLSQKRRSLINSNTRREKAIALLEKKLKRFESNYLFFDVRNEPFSEKAIEHSLSIHILKCYAKSLDAHTYFFSEDEAREMRASLEKQFEGVGLVLSEGIDGVVVTDIIKNSPADSSNLIEINDIIVEIDGKSVEEHTFEEVLEVMKGKDQNVMVIGFIKVDENENRSSLKRVSLSRKSISMEEDRLQYSYEDFGNGIIGKLDLRSFYENANGVNSEKDMKAAINILRQKGQLKGLILDLRENAGGFLSQAVKIASLFISNGVVVISKDSQGHIRYLRNIDSQNFYKGPLVILTSKLSASASEIVAQALQDYGVALVVGDETTFGKGSIQYQTVTDIDAEYFYKVTVGKYYTVSGKTTQIDGVQADIVVPTTYSAYTFGEKYLEFPLKSDSIAAVYDDPLTDLDLRTRFWFKQNYSPNLQKKVIYWQKMVPQLKKNSQERMSKDPNFQNFLKKQQIIQAKNENRKIPDIDYQNFGEEDLQMQEAVNILKDMIYIEAKSRKAANL